MSHRVKVRMLQALSVLILIGAWLYGNGPGEVPGFLLPPLTGVLTSFWRSLSSNELWDALGWTLLEILLAGLIAAVSGLLVGFVMARTAFRAQVVEPLLAWGYMAPLVLFYPIFLLWFGVGMWSKVGYAAVSAFFPVAFNCLRAFRSTDPRYARMARAFGASPQQIDRFVKLRAALPVVVAGLRLGAATTFVTVIVAEMLGSTAGLGYLISRAADTFAVSRAYAGVLTVLLVVALFQMLLTRAVPTGHVPRRRTRRRSPAGSGAP